MEKSNEQSWIERAQAGDREAIGYLYKTYWRAARATAFGVMGDYHLAEDAAADAFAAAMAGLQGLKDPSRFGPWMRTIVLRTARRKLADKSPQASVDLKSCPDSEYPSPQARLEQREMAACIHQAVANLSEVLRETVSLYYFEGYNLDEAARFLDVPTGSLKRRLHEGRVRLRETAQLILQGKRTLDPIHERILQQLKELAEGSLDREQFNAVMGQAMWMRPLPHDLMRQAFKRYSQVAQKMTTSEGKAKMEQQAKEVMAFAKRPSVRALDPNHAIGKMVNSIRAALPAFHQWIIDDSAAAHHLLQVMSGSDFSSQLPPGFAEGTPGSYYYLCRGSLFPDEQGRLQPICDIAKNKDMAQKHQLMVNARLSDVLVLQWMTGDTIELRAVETLLQELVQAVLPQAAIRFSSYQEPRYRFALRLHLGEIAMPAALGGPLAPWKGEPERGNMALIQIFLEAWAMARTGEVLELDKIAPILEQLMN